MSLLSIKLLSNRVLRTLSYSVFDVSFIEGGYETV
jgi:hypothetical protein